MAGETNAAADQLSRCLVLATDQKRIELEKVVDKVKERKTNDEVALDKKLE